MRHREHVATETVQLLKSRWREPDSNLYGAFPVKWSFWFVGGSLFGGESRSSSRRLRSGSRSGRKGSRDRNGSIAWSLCPWRPIGGWFLCPWRPIGGWNREVEPGTD